MTPIPWRIVLVACATTAACTIGPSAEDYAPARTPRGLGVVVDLSPVGARWPGARLRAELLAVGDSGLYLLAEGGTPAGEAPTGIVFTPWRTIERTDSPHRRVDVGERTSPDPEEREHLARLARFPQGMSAELLARLLEAYDQDSLLSAPAPTGTAGMSLDAFLGAANRAADGLADPARATAAGYRRIDDGAWRGLDRLWVHPGHLIHGVFDPLRPAGLLFRSSDGGETLRALLYARSPAETRSPSLAPLPPATWRRVGPCPPLALPGVEPAAERTEAWIGSGCLLLAWVDRYDGRDGLPHDQ